MGLPHRFFMRSVRSNGFSLYPSRRLQAVPNKAYHEQFANKGPTAHCAAEHPAYHIKEKTPSRARINARDKRYDLWSNRKEKVPRELCRRERCE